ncbi:hypothetical protein BKK50_08125 [Rodentibacter rarus]|uniref:Uncharacterized protein n=1 Tax=Rodentibacter rarus TaxID=1908260 RepID=A0A1V3IK68_9PAST|nr:hypothetical protein BKK50_08125 [Rodentibacter rarus]
MVLVQEKTWIRHWILTASLVIWEKHMDVRPTTSSKKMRKETKEYRKKCEQGDSYACISYK